METKESAFVHNSVELWERSRIDWAPCDSVLATLLSDTMRYFSQRSSEVWPRCLLLHSVQVWQGQHFATMTYGNDVLTQIWESKTVSQTRRLLSISPQNNFQDNEHDHRVSLSFSTCVCCCPLTGLLSVVTLLNTLAHTSFPRVVISHHGVRGMWCCVCTHWFVHGNCQRKWLCNLTDWSYWHITTSFLQAMSANTVQIQPVADTSMHIEDRSPASTTASESFQQETDFQRPELQKLHSELTRSKATNTAFWREQSRNTLNYQDAGFREATQRQEQAARDQVEAAVAEATAQTQTSMVSNMMRIEQLAEHTTTAQQFKLVAETNTLAETALTKTKEMHWQTSCRRNSKSRWSESATLSKTLVRKWE